MADSESMPQGGAATGLSEPVGTRLRRAREAAGLGLPQMSDITKIPSRMLELIEQGDFAALPARTYATGFTRSYARALGLPEAEIVAAVRAELGLGGPVETGSVPAFEPGDPARIPTARLAWLAALGAVAVVIAGLFLWRTYYSPAVSLPPLAADPPTAAPSVAASPIPPALQPPADPGLPLASDPAAGPSQGAVAPSGAGPAAAGLRGITSRATTTRTVPPAAGGALPSVGARAAAEPAAASTGVN